MWQVSGFLWRLVSSINKTDHHDIVEILLKEMLNTISLTLTPYSDGSIETLIFMC
jgi:hypothetical protein